VPMAVPVNCSQNVLPNENMLFCMTASNTSRNRYEGKSGEIISLFVSKNSLIDWIPVVVSMFVYIDLAPAVNTWAFSGMTICLSSFMIEVEFLT